MSWLLYQWYILVGGFMANRAIIIDGFGRAESDELRDKRFELRLTQTEFDALNEKAKSFGLDRSTFVRAMSLGSFTEASGMHTKDDWENIKELYEFTSALNRVESEVAKTRIALNGFGNNLNQIAKGVNRSAAQKKGVPEVTFETREGVADAKRSLDSVNKSLSVITDVCRGIRDALGRDE